MKYVNSKKNILQSTPKLLDVDIQDIYHTKMPRCMHRHDDRVEIMVIQKGQGIHQIGGKTYATKAGDILIYDAYVLHDELADQNTGIEILGCAIANVQVLDLPPNNLLIKNACPVIRDSSYLKEIQSLLNIIYALKNNSADFKEELQDHLLASLLILVYKAGEKNNEAPIKRAFEIGLMVQDYIDKHYLEDIDIPNIAETLKIGESYVSRTFKKATGYSVAQYIIRRRIGEAQSWLLMSNLSVTDIAMKVGYNSVSNFHSTFNRIVGMSPQQYRKYFQKKI